MPNTEKAPRFTYHFTRLENVNSKTAKSGLELVSFKGYYMSKDKKTGEVKEKHRFCQVRGKSIDPVRDAIVEGPTDLRVFGEHIRLPADPERGFETPINIFRIIGKSVPRVKAAEAEVATETPVSLEDEMK